MSRNRRFRLPRRRGTSSGSGRCRLAWPGPLARWSGFSAGAAAGAGAGAVGAAGTGAVAGSAAGAEARAVLTVGASAVLPAAPTLGLLEVVPLVRTPSSIDGTPFAAPLVRTSASPTGALPDPATGVPGAPGVDPAPGGGFDVGVVIRPAPRTCSGYSDRALAPNRGGWVTHASSYSAPDGSTLGTAVCVSEVTRGGCPRRRSGVSTSTAGLAEEIVSLVIERRYGRTVSGRRARTNASASRAASSASIASRSVGPAANGG